MNADINPDFYPRLSVFQIVSECSQWRGETFFSRQGALWQAVIAADADGLSGREPLEFFLLLRFCFN